MDQIPPEEASPIALGDGFGLLLRPYAISKHILAKKLADLLGIDWRQAQEKFPGAIPCSLMRSDLDSLFSGELEYEVTEKSNGLRFLLIFTSFKSGPIVYLLNRALEVVCLDLPAGRSIFKGTVLDGELVFNKKLQRHELIIWDTLVACGICYLDNDGRTRRAAGRICFEQHILPYQEEQDVLAAEEVVMVDKTSSPPMMTKSTSKRPLTDNPGITEAQRKKLRTNQPNPSGKEGEDLGVTEGEQGKKAASRKRGRTEGATEKLRANPPLASANSSASPSSGKATQTTQVISCTKSTKSLPPLLFKRPFHIRTKAVHQLCDLRFLINRVIPNQGHDNDGLIFTAAELPYTMGHNPRQFKYKTRQDHTVEFIVRLPSGDPSAVTRHQCLSEPVNRIPLSSDVVEVELWCSVPRSYSTPPGVARVQCIVPGASSSSSSGGIASTTTTTSAAPDSKPYNAAPKYDEILYTRTYISQAECFPRLHIRGGRLIELEGKIVECEMDSVSRLWNLKHLRYDRLHCNNLRTVEKTIRNIQENITIQELLPPSRREIVT